MAYHHVKFKTFGIYKTFLADVEAHLVGGETCDPDFI